jgi:hypothetical protein
MNVGLKNLKNVHEPGADYIVILLLTAGKVIRQIAD